MLKRVAECISRYNMFERGQSAGVAVSGGADSVCLLHVLAELAPRWALQLTVLHLDHQLRGAESRQDADFVQDLARRMGLEVHLRTIDVARRKAETGTNLEEAAREARRQFFWECLRSGRVDRVALGHTRSDQAETVLFRLLRGCGSAGLAGILPVTDEGIVRPLLEVDRSEVEHYLRERGITWREDSSNRDLTYARNRIRHQLLPALAKEWNPALPRALAHLATLAGDEERCWDQEIDRLAVAHLVRLPRAVLVSTGSLRSLARPVARRLLRRAICEVKGDLRGVEFVHVEAVLDLAGEKKGHGRARIPGVEIVRSFDWLRLALPGEWNKEGDSFQVPVQAPGTVTLPAGNRVLVLSVCDWDERNCGLDLDRLAGPFEVRNWRPGDRYRPAGHRSCEKIKALLHRHRIALWDRRGWPILTAGGAIVWARRFGPAAGYAAGPGSRRVLQVSETEDLTSPMDREWSIQRLNVVRDTIVMDGRPGLGAREAK